MSVTCHCGNPGSYDTCCKPLHNGKVLADSAEQLMRSRYSAFVVLNEMYLLSTWHETTRPGPLNLDAGQKWIGLKINNAIKNEPDKVEFTARFKINGKAHRLHELSRFIHENGQWFYVDGDILE